MGWDANISTSEFKGKLPLQSFNQLQAAIKERCQGAAVAVPSIFNSDMVKMSDMLPDTWFSTYQSTMTTLIAAYVNHTDHSGDWNGQTTIPNWTEATILTAIGDASRLAAPSSRKCKEWCFQQCEMINMMRWIKKLIPTVADTEIQSVGWAGAFPTAQEAYDDAISRMSSSSWSVVTGSGVGKLSSQARVFYYFGDYDATASRKRMKRRYTSPFPYTANIDRYYWIIPETGTPVFNDLWGGAIESTYYKRYSFEIEPGDTWDDGWETMDPQVFPGIPPPDPVGNISNVATQMQADCFYNDHLVAKFDGPNGFTFRGDDW